MVPVVAETGVNLVDLKVIVGLASALKTCLAISASNFDMSYILDPRRANLTLMLDNVLSWVKKIDHYTGLNRVAVPVSQLSSKTSEKIEFLVNDLF